MKNICLSTYFFLLIASAYSQDNIILKNGDEILSKIMEISETELSYKKYSNPDGPTYRISTSKIFMVKFENGEKEMFRISESTPASSAKIYDDNILVDERDDKRYKTVQIGNQTWMAENLAFKADKGCWAYDDFEQLAEKYGYLYSWETANGACPDGWHLPSDDEWGELEVYLGMRISQAKEWGFRENYEIAETLKSESGWAENCNGSNETGFNILPAGSKPNPNFSYLGEMAFFWTSSPRPNAEGLHMYINRVLYKSYKKCHGIDRSGRSDYWAHSVRCIKDKL